ncbi:penicillin-binding protein 1C [Desertivirga xinjiangensis]|uniref:penicillin-binding protein 1C n=1 Tax=Desertivirga xinjiangensis TaxID=539206 RepID=UPI00210C8498|nr:penicillin-binding protein 1C [Pedobacter xinjiangensis]
MSRTKKTALLCALVLLTAFTFCLPEPLFVHPTSFVIESVEGELLSASTARDGQWRFPKNDSVPEKFKQCIIAFEDKRFYRHPGVDILAVARAIRQNFSKGRVVSGGSTLSMQVIRLSQGNKRTLINKLFEAIKALRLELRYNKEEIISLYAANAPFGSNVVGLDAAAWRYFGRPASSLSWGEAATLAVLPNSPSLVHPGKNRDRLRVKRDRLISILEHEKVIDADEAMLASIEPLPGKPFPLPQSAPHLMSLVKSDFKKNKLSSTLVRSSIQSQLQNQVSDILWSHRQRLAANEVSNCAALVLDVESGQALAYVGNIYQPENTEAESYVDVIQAPRSPGSTLKPLLYAAMLNEGMLLPNSLIPDIPTQISGYQPNNYDLGYDGAVPASKALARSLNVPAVRMLQQYRYERFHDFLKSTGVSTLIKPPDFYGLSLILGGCETTMWELSGIYASMARTLKHYRKNRGKYAKSDWRPPTYLANKANDRELEKNGKLDASAIYYTFEAMNEVMRPGEELLWKQFSSSRKIAWKTGTSFGFRDAWAIGVTPQYLVAVWAGNTDGEGRPGLTGIDAAAPILFDIFRSLPPGSTQWFEMPSPEMKLLEVCKQSGFKASTMCTSTEKMHLPVRSSNAAVCNFHKLVHLERSGRFQVSSECESPSEMIHKSWFVLPPAMEYYYKSKDYSYQSLPPFREDCAGNIGGNVMELIYPRHNARIYVPVELDGKRGQVIFNAAHQKSDTKVFWHLDDEFVGSTRDIHQIALNPSAGKHQITLVDQQGNRLQQAFVILDKEKN